MPKERGDISQWRDRRNRELVAVYFARLRELNDKHEAVRQSVVAPCSRFYVDVITAYNAVVNLMNGRCVCCRPEKAEMYAEIYRRVMKMVEAGKVEKNKRGGNVKKGMITLQTAVSRVVHSKAPKFYLTEKTARILIYSTIRKK